MAEREFPIEPVLSGASSALFTVAAYFFATLLGICLGAWSAGWDRVGAQGCMYECLESGLGLRKPVGLSSFFGLGMLTLIYYQFHRARWESINALVLLGTIYMYVAMGAGDADPMGVVMHRMRVPGWRIVASVVIIVAVYAAGRVVFFLGRARAPRST